MKIAYRIRIYLMVFAACESLQMKIEWACTLLIFVGNAIVYKVEQRHSQKDEPYYGLAAVHLPE